MFTCYYYWLLAPNKGELKDDEHRPSAFSIVVQSPNVQDCDLALYCDDSGCPEFFRLKIPGLVNEEIPEPFLPLLQVCREHMLSVLRMTFRNDVMLGLVSTAYSFVHDGQAHSVGLLFEVLGDEPPFDAEAARSLFIHSLGVRHDFRLYLDGTNEQIPLQYRYLSLFKMIENRLKINDRWDWDALNAVLQPYIEKFSTLAFSRPIKETILDLRDRCAHVRTGGRLGVTHLNLDAAKKVEQVLPFLRSICAALLNEQTGGTFILATENVHSPPISISDAEHLPASSH